MGVVAFAVSDWRVVVVAVVVGLALVALVVELMTPPPGSEPWNPDRP